MTPAMPARHRSSERARTPLTAISGGLAGRATAFGRAGVVVAASSGLVAATCLPARAGGFVEGGIAAGDVVRSGSAPPASRSAPQTTLAAVVDSPNPPIASRPDPVTPATRVKVKPRARRKLPPAIRSAGDEARPASVVELARRYLGVPYVSGGSTPGGWDCSGSNRYIFAQLGYSLPRTSNEQYAHVRRISAAQARPGDLVFFLGASGRVSHTGIYAGDWMIYDAGRSGRVYSLRAIWSAHVSFGRVAG